MNYDGLIKSLKSCGKLETLRGSCIAFHDGCCEAEPLCMYELMRKAADAIEELSREVKSLYKILGAHPDPKGENGDPGVTLPEEENTDGT